LFQRLLTEASDCVCSAVTFTECVMVLIGKRAATPLREVEALFGDLKVRPAALDPEQGRLAAEAFIRFGKGRHWAGLNLGDCFSYALAKSLQAPL
ncbi:PIN domain-containing protein, partial [Mycobacterium tuberculosis]